MKYFSTTDRLPLERLSTQNISATSHPPSPFVKPVMRESSIAVANYIEPAVSRGHILIIDDEISIRLLLEQVLSASGYRVSSAEDGEAGWSALCVGDYDLVITDHDMPRLTGLDFLRRLRAVQSDCPVILISGDMPWKESDLLEILQPGLALEKPFSFIELMADIRSLLNKVRIAQRILQGSTS